MTDQELKDIVAAVVAELEKSGVDFDYKAEQAKDDDLVFVIRGTAPNYQGVTVTWKGLLDIITAQATQAKNDAETAKNAANTILEQVQSKGTEITNFVATSKAELETQKNESVNAVKSVYQTDLNELKGDLDDRIEVDWWNLVKGLPILEGVAINGTSQISNASQFSIKGEIEVNPSTNYYVYCDGNSAYPTVGARFINFLDSSKALISTLNSGSDNTRNITTPANCKYITITFTYASGQKGTYYLTDKVDAERINYYNTHGTLLPLSDVDVLNAFSFDTEAWNIVADCSGYNLQKGKYYNGNIVGTGSFFSVLEIPIEPNTTYYAECSPNPNYQNAFARFLNYYDSSNTLISTISYPTGVFKTPYNAHYISVSLVNTSKTADTIALSDFTWYITSDYVKADKSVIEPQIKATSIETLEDTNKKVDSLNLLKAENRIATINFQFDDGSIKDANIVSIFEPYGIPCGFALISGVLPIARISEYLEYQSKGFEILSHSTDYDGMNDASISPATIEAKLKTSRETLKDYGFNVRGFVTPYSTMSPAFIPIMAKYYDFGATVYFGEYSGDKTPYQAKTDATTKLFRVSVQSTTLANQKKAVDEAIANGGFLTFYGHSADLDGSDNETTANLNDLLAYIKGKESDSLCYVLKPSDAVDYYFHVRHSDYLELLNA